ncbi:MAG: HAD-IA family hydrolase, partial [Burkholderiales bacterium]|nr:HAD-IA family hydrolase [Burkholderiales bacterium]
MIRAVLFDLDGTLADTAPDLAGALNRMREARNLEPLPLELLRIHVSNGARGMLGAGFGIKPGDADFIAMRDEFLDRYLADLKRDSELFSDIPPLLDALEDRGYIWGVVTNKQERYALPLIDLLELTPRAACVVCGDTTPHAKPHPAPLLEAAKRIAVDPAHCIYVGDDQRDVVAAHAAGMGSVAAAYGYLGDEIPLDEWGAHHRIERPLELLNLL